MKPIKRLLVENIKAAGAKGDAGEIAEMVMTYFSGTSIEQNFLSNASGRRRIESFMVVREIALEAGSVFLGVGFCAKSGP